MPTFNRASVLMRAIDSVLSQTHTELELIIINDGSTDNTAELLASLHDKRIAVITQDNAGAAAARNAALQKARGTYAAYLDSDNIWHPTFLEVMLQEIGVNVLAYCSQNLLLCDVKNGSHKIIARKTRTQASAKHNRTNRSFR